MSALPSTEVHSNVVAPTARSGIVEIEQARAVAQSMAEMQLARRNPRDELAARDKIINDFTQPKLAELAKYSYSRGGTDIEGPSIHALHAIAKRWGNLRCGIEELSRANGMSECRAFAVDLETGFADEKKFVVRHIRDTKGGGKILTDERDIYELIANMGSRRKRACLEAVIPSDVVQEAMGQVDVTLAADFEITPKYLSSLQEAFGKFGVTKPMLEARIQRHLDAMTPAQAVSLRKIHTSLKDGMSEPGDWFDMSASTTQAAPAAPKGTEGVKEKMRTRSKPADMAPAPEPAPPPQAGPDPITDVVKALLAIDNATDEGEGSGVIDRCHGQPFYGKVVEAFNARFRTTI